MEKRQKNSPWNNDWPDKSNPCGNCPARGCGSYHDECEQYLEWKAIRTKIKEQTYTQKRQKADLDNLRRDGVEKARRCSRYKHF